MNKDQRELFRVYVKKEIALYLKSNSERILSEFCKKYNIEPQQAKDDRDADSASATDTENINEQ